MKKYEFSWEHCYGDWREQYIYAQTDEEARERALEKKKDLGNQITGGPELVLIGEVIDL